MGRTATVCPRDGLRCLPRCSRRLSRHSGCAQALGGSSSMSSRRLPLPAVRSSIFVCQVGRSQHSNLHAHRLRTLLPTGASPTVGPVMLSAAAERVSGDRRLGWPLPPRCRPHGGPRQRDGAARSTRCEPATRRPPQASGQVARLLGGERGDRKRLRAPLAAGCAAAGASRGASEAMPQRRRAASAMLPGTGSASSGPGVKHMHRSAAGAGRRVE